MVNIKDSNNVDSEIHYFKDGSIPLFCLPRRLLISYRPVSDIYSLGLKGKV